MSTYSSDFDILKMFGEDVTVSHSTTENNLRLDVEDGSAYLSPIHARAVIRALQWGLDQLARPYGPHTGATVTCDVCRTCGERIAVVVLQVDVTALDGPRKFVDGRTVPEHLGPGPYDHWPSVAGKETS